MADHSVSSWTLAKYVLAFAGLMLVLGGDRLGRPWLGYVGLGLVAVAFGLRIKHGAQHRQGPERPESRD